MLISIYTQEENIKFIKKVFMSLSSIVIINTQN